MANSPTNLEAHRPGNNGERPALNAANNGLHPRPREAVPQGPWAAEEHDNAGRARVTTDSDPLGLGDLSSDVQAEIARLEGENARLKEAVAELQRALGEATAQADQAWAERAREYESLLEEKSEVIRNLHRKFQEAPERPAGNSPREEELLALSEELERERRQLQEDEEAMMQQMQQMEVQMARERAELARQRMDLQRLQSEVQREVEKAQAVQLPTREMLRSKLQDITNRRS